MNFRRRQLTNKFITKRLAMTKYLSPVGLSHLQAFRYWLHSVAPEWDIALPEDAVVDAGKEYPSFQLYRHGVAVGLVASPIEALEKINDRKLYQEYKKYVCEDPDTPLA
jgi:hypothetical protein